MADWDRVTCSFMFCFFVEIARSESPNDPKLRDSGVRRGSCVVGGKAAAEAATVTHGAVLCSAWLGDVRIGFIASVLVHVVFVSGAVVLV